MSSRDRKIELDLEIKNIGPHKNLHRPDKTDSIKIGLYGKNGVGKTFISRAFRLASPSNFTQLCNSKTTNNLLTSNTQNGEFVFKIANNEKVQTLEIKLKRNLKPQVTNNTDYLFHVFNSDYVEDNLELTDYNPADNIDGYILGKVNIDVSKEKLNLTNKKRKYENNEKILENAIENEKEELYNLNISKQLKEYKEINLKNILSDIDVEEADNFESLKKDYNKLISLPDDLKDIKHVDHLSDNSILFDVSTILKKEYNRSELPQNLVSDIKSNQDFIENGINLYYKNNEECPFCKEKLTDQGLKLIESYIKYLNNSEAKTIKKINKMINKLKELSLDIEKKYNDFNKTHIEFDKLKIYFPSFKNDELQSLRDNTILFEKIAELIKMLEIKKKDIKSINFEFKEQIDYINNFLIEIGKDLDKQINKIDSLNKVKNSLNEEKLMLKRRLCKAKYLSIEEEQKIIINDINDLATQISNLKAEISEKENKSRIDRRKKVIESFKFFLNIFFDKKYDFDEEKFSIKFEDEILSDNATNVLSDGEKGIVAFCYYLATVHTIIEKEDDYDRLFFVIDDPISSMDYNFVYHIANFIDNIPEYFNLKKKYGRFIILTHNLEFMNLLMRNGIINQKYVISDNKIKFYRKELMLPYESHLHDIVKVYNGEKPTHTTANSIRHVLETICTFEDQNKQIETYINEDDDLKSCSYLNLLIQNLSHGRFPNTPLTEDNITIACKTVTEFINNKYPGQIKNYLN